MAGPWLAGRGPFRHDASIDRAVKIVPPIRRCELHTLQGDLGRELEGTGHRSLQPGLDEVGRLDHHRRQRGHQGGGRSTRRTARAHSLALHAARSGRAAWVPRRTMNLAGPYQEISGTEVYRSPDPASTYLESRRC